MYHKALLRNEIKSRLRGLDPAHILSSSEVIVEKLLTHPIYLDSTVLCVYLSMPFEVSTSSIIRHSLDKGKRIFVPKVTGKSSSNMVMVEVSSIDQIARFQKNAWGIPEPPMDEVNPCPNFWLNSIDTIIVPGVAFNSQLSRLGHGKGYYGD